MQDAITSDAKPVGGDGFLLNEKTKVWMPIAVLCIIIGGAFGAGVIYSKLSAHTEDSTKHETATQKQARIDRAIAPLQRGQERTERNLEQIEAKVDRLLERN